MSYELVDGPNFNEAERQAKLGALFMANYLEGGLPAIDSMLIGYTALRHVARALLEGTLAIQEEVRGFNSLMDPAEVDARELWLRSVPIVAQAMVSDYFDVQRWRRDLIEILPKGP